MPTSICVLMIQTASNSVKTGSKSHRHLAVPCFFPSRAIFIRSPGMAQRWSPRYAPTSQSSEVEPRFWLLRSTALWSCLDEHDEHTQQIPPHAVHAGMFFLMDSMAAGTKMFAADFSTGSRLNLFIRIISP